MANNSQSFVVKLTGAQVREPFLAWYDSLSIKEKVKYVNTLLNMLRYEGSPFTVNDIQSITRNLRRTSDLAYNTSNYNPHGSYYEYMERGATKRLITLLKSGGIDTSIPWFSNLKKLSDSLGGVDLAKLVESGVVTMSMSDIEALEKHLNLDSEGSE